MKPNGDTVAGKKIEIVQKDTDGPRAGYRQAPRAGARHARQRGLPRRLRLHAERAGGRAGGDRSEEADGHHECRDLDHHHPIAVHRARRR